MTDRYLYFALLVEFQLSVSFTHRTCSSTLLPSGGNWCNITTAVHKFKEEIKSTVTIFLHGNLQMRQVQHQSHSIMEYMALKGNYSKKTYFKICLWQISSSCVSLCFFLASVELYSTLVQRCSQVVHNWRPVLQTPL